MKNLNLVKIFYLLESKKALLMALYMNESFWAYVEGKLNYSNFRIIFLLLAQQLFLKLDKFIWKLEKTRLGVKFVVVLIKFLKRIF